MVLDSAILSVNGTAGLVVCSQILGQTIREDIGMMFGQFHTNTGQFGARLLKLNKEKNWLIPPPLQVSPPIKK